MGVYRPVSDRYLQGRGGETSRSGHQGCTKWARVGHQVWDQHKSVMIRDFRMYRRVWPSSGVGVMYMRERDVSVFLRDQVGERKV